MTDPIAAHSFLVSEVERLAPLDFVAAVPGGNLFHVVEVTRLESGALEVRVPGRPLVAPELDSSTRATLREHGFESTDPSDRTRPWVRAVDDATSAVDVLQDLLVHVFGEEKDAKLDIAHGDHRMEVEAKRKLALARTRIESIVSEMLGDRAEQDADGDYVLPIAEVHVMVSPRAAPTGEIVIRIFAITNVAVTVAPELGLFLARLNFGLMFGRFALDAENRAIWFDESILGEEFREEELRFAIRMVAATADEWDDRLKQMFGGATYQEVLQGRTAEPTPPTKPGEGTGLYL